MQAFRFDTLFITADDPHFERRVAEAYARKERPLCMCLRSGEGLPMYVSRHGDRYSVKRMPNSGSRHHPDCEAYEPPPELSGLGEVDGAAIHEDVETGLTQLRLDFSLSKHGARPAPNASAGTPDTVRSDGLRLTQRGLLHYLWDRAQLNRWTPRMAGKRSWYVVRKHLLEAAAGACAKGVPLTEALFIPEPFSLEHKAKIVERRMARLAALQAGTGSTRKLMLLLGEVKAIEPGRYGHRLVVKHLPDFPLTLTPDLHHRVRVRFEHELRAWTADPATHLVTLATFGIGPSGAAAVEELCLALTTAHWIPVDHLFDAQLVEGLTRAERRFTKGLRYNLPAERPLASAVLSDTEPSAVALYVVPPGASDSYRQSLAELTRSSDLAAWLWHPGDEPLPALPQARARAT